MEGSKNGKEEEDRRWKGVRRVRRDEGRGGREVRRVRWEGAAERGE